LPEGGQQRRHLRVTGGLERELHPRQQQVSLVQPAHEEPGHRLDGRFLAERARRQVGREPLDVLGEAVRDVLGEGEHQCLARAQIRRAAALGEACLTVHRPMGESAQAVLGHDAEGGRQQQLHARAERRLGHRSSLEGVTRETTRPLACAVGSAYLLQT
jgi:hypothetical protein